jgi:hypothetical protein
LRALRANRVFRADEKRIRTENTVPGNPEQGAGVFSEIVDGARMVFHPCASGDPRGWAAARASSLTSD